MDSPEELLPTLSICTGVRGLERGVERVTGPLRTIAYVEIEAFIIENLLAGMEAGILAPTAVWANLKTFDWRPFRHKIFLLVGGYPCQPFSNAGRRRGEEDPRHLWPYIEGGIGTARPVCVWFENVRGHLDLGAEQVLISLRALGYAVELGIYSAEEVGAPHQRARVFLLGILADAKDYVRGLYERSWKPGAKATHTPGTGEMDDAGRNGRGPQYGISTRGNGIESAGEVLADPCSAAWRTGDTGRNRDNSRELSLCGGREEDSSRPEPSGEAVADPTFELRDGLGNEGQRRRTEHTDGCQKMADPDGNGPGTNAGGTIHSCGKAEGKEQWQERDEIFRERNGSHAGDDGAAGDHMAYASCPGLEERREQPAWQERQAIERGSGALAHPNVWRQQQWIDRGMGRQPQSNAWPAGPGQPQYSWEAPRTIESGVGCSAHGYNFREDLLRALGNGVVEDQSEYAFRDLLRKHFE